MAQTDEERTRGHVRNRGSEATRAKEEGVARKDNHTHTHTETEGCYQPTNQSNPPATAAHTNKHVGYLTKPHLNREYGAPTETPISWSSGCVCVCGPILYECDPTLMAPRWELCRSLSETPYD